MTDGAEPARQGARAALEELYRAARRSAPDPARRAAIERAYQHLVPLLVAVDAARAAEDDLLDPVGAPLDDGIPLSPLPAVAVPWEELVPPPPAHDPLAGDPAAPTIRRLVATIVQEAQPPPLAVLVFGSHARRDYRARSDIDLLVVVPDDTDTRRAAAAIEALLPLEGVEVDVLAATPARLAAARGDAASVLYGALAHGVTLYRTARAAARMRSA